MLLEKVTVFRPWHASKVEVLISLSPSGMNMVSKLFAPLNALSPRFTSMLAVPKVAVPKAMHCSNALFPITSTLSGTVMPVSFEL